MWLYINYAVRYQCARFTSHGGTEFLSSCSVLFLFSVCFHAFHGNLSFSILSSNSYDNGMPVARSRFSAWHSAENIGRSPVACSHASLLDGYWMSGTVFSSLLCSIYLSWRMLITCRHTHRHEAHRWRWTQRSDPPGLSHMQRVFISLQSCFRSGWYDKYHNGFNRLNICRIFLSWLLSMMGFWCLRLIE